MPIIGGFPFILPDNHSLLVYMPHWNAVDRKVYWQGIADSYQTQPDGEPRPFEAQLAMWAWLNKLNPDWQQITDDTPYDFGVVSDTTQFPLLDVSDVIVEVTDGSQYVDRWWGSAQIGKYGVVNFVGNGVDFMPLYFCNTQSSSIRCPALGATGFSVTMMPGVQAHIVAKSRTNKAQYESTVPPVYYNTAGPQYSGWGTKQLEPTSIFSLDGTP